jgi:hypothetical protein
VNFTPVDRGADSPIVVAGYQLIQNTDQYRALWTAHHKGEELKNSGVDFNQNTIIAVFGGRKSIPEGLTDDSQLSLEFLQRTDTSFKLYLAKMEPGSKILPPGTRLATIEKTPYAFYFAPYKIQKIDVMVYNSKTGTWQELKPLDEQK